VRGANKIKRSE